MADMLWTWVFLTFSSHLVVSYPGRKCGSPELYSGKFLEDRYALRREFNTGERVMYRCEHGSTTDGGSRYSYCRDGEWTRLELQCKRKLCGSAGEILNGRFRQTGNAFGDTAEAVCNQGYVLQGNPIRRCHVDGWSGTIPTCVVDDLFTSFAKCPLLKKSKNATYHGTKGMYEPGETLSYSCNVGFRLIGDSNVLHCDITGKWNPNHANCERVRCEKVIITHSKVKFRHLTYDTKVNISCKHGYHLKGPSVVTCGADGFWTPAIPTCESTHVMPTQVKCLPPVVPNSVIQVANKMEYVVGERATIHCQAGFELIGSSWVTCGAHGQWQEIPECRSAKRIVLLETGRCNSLPIPEHAHLQHVNHVELDVAVRYRCNPGYRMVRGPNTIYCKNGRWSDLKMKCERKKCGSAGEILNGHYHYTGAFFGDTVTARCNIGYQLVGAGVRNCTEYGWDGREAVCEAIQCPEPDVVPDADLHFDTSGIIRYGYMASYTCRYGTLVGASDIYCTEDGTWSAPAPRCEVVICPPPIVRNGIIVSGHRPRYQYRSLVKFRCNPGKTLLGPDVITCEEDGKWHPRLPDCRHQMIH